MNANITNPFRDIEFVFLDRDGVLNRKLPDGHFVTRPDELEILPGISPAVAELNRSGRKVIVVTNQRGVAMGLYSLDELAHIHDRLKMEIAADGGHVDAIYVCPHDVGQCNCRKPLTGLFEQAFQDFPGASPANSVVVGDSPRDVEAGARLGMRSVFLFDESAPATPEIARAKQLATACLATLPDFVRVCCKQEL